MIDANDRCALLAGVWTRATHWVSLAGINPSGFVHGCWANR